MDNPEGSNASLKHSSTIIEKIGSKQSRFVFLGCIVAFALYAGVFRSPASFPVATVIRVPEDSSLREVATLLKENRVVKSAAIFEFLVRIVPGTLHIKYGDYYLEEREWMFGIALRFLRGDFGMDSLKITIPEGTSIREMAALYGEQFPAIDKEAFIARAKKDEGYLFPDTYFFLPNVKAEEIYRTMRDTFDKKIAEVGDEIAGSGHTPHEIVTMASLLEEEARTTETRRIIAGILWKRFSIGMPLQVDAAFLYINGKDTFALTLEDLAIDSPYNTYKYPGLPPGPITNPGMDAIFSALNPVETSYFYYLSDKEGNMHYGKTFEEHKINKEKYLR